MKKTLGLPVSVLLLFLAMPLAGCSNTITLPWETNALDPSRIATREPLDIPPDMDRLPGQESATDRQTMSQESSDPSLPTSARTILFNTPQAQEQKPLNRNEQEQLPDWLDSSRGAK